MEILCRTRRRKIVSWFCCISVVIAASLAAVFTIAVLFKPRELQVSVSDASLSQFSFSSESDNTNNDHSLSYSLSLSLSLRNPNRRGAAVIYERVRIAAFYNGAEFSAKNLSFSDTPLRQGKRNTTVLHVELHGRTDGFFGGGDVAAYEAETLAGEYSLEVRVVMRVRAKYGGGVESRFFDAPEILCGALKVPLVNVNGSGLPAVKFRATKCRNVFIFKTRDTVKHHDGYF